ncbi:acyltransferase family protein [Furfurilactobacillus milii]|uniref:Acyltransferase family protein n=1 Tax=Furfurilactobacillus milii TaxID=2888272 RepID=A0A6N9I400_9LACO|nr:acyltransferase family protein [Furfurilactobacillus milii]MYV17569.1 acyltransferase family protein [Furfurilactobacillus milii]
MKKRIEWLDVARGIAILAVIIGHTFEPQTYSMQTFPAKLIFAFHMPLFFIVAGYFFHEQRLNEVVIKGIKNLLVPYFGTAAILVLAFFVSKVKVLPMIFFSPFHSFSQLLISILYGFGGGPFGTVNPFGWNIALIGIIWFLMAMFWANIIFQGIYQISKRFVYSEVVLAIFVVIIVVFGINLSRVWILPMALDSAFLAIAFIYTGYLMQKIDLEQLVSEPIVVIFSAILWLFSAKNGLFQMSSVSFVPTGDFLTAVVGGIASTVVIFSLSVRLKKINLVEKTLSVFGRRSLVMMCFHAIDVGVLVFSANVINFTQVYSRPVVFVSLMFYRLLIPIVFTLLMPRIPILRGIYLPRFVSKKQKARLEK